MLVSLVAAAAALSAAPQVAAPTSTAREQVLSYGWKAGRTIRYRLAADIKGAIPLFENPEPIELTAKLDVIYVAKVISVSSDGSADVSFKVESAEAEIADIPFAIPMDDAEKILNQRVRYARSGEVISTTGGQALPFSLSIPGIDPKRLYTLLFPIVFQPTPVGPGDTWDFKCGLLGGDDSPVKFTAAVLAPGDSTGSASDVRLSDVFAMDIDQKLTADKKPATSDADTHKTRKGRITGDGVFRFDPAKGIFTRGQLRLKASIDEVLIGTPQGPSDIPKVTTTVDALVKISVEPPKAPAKKKPAKGGPKPSGKRRGQ